MTEEFWFDEEEGKVHIKRFQDVQDTLDLNKQMFNAAPISHLSRRDSPVHLKARIPLSLIEKWKAEEGFDWFQSTDMERRRRLNDPNYRHLLVRPGRM